MFRKMVLSRIAAGALALGVAVGFAAAAQAQTLTCKYVTGQVDPLAVLNDVTDEFEVPISVFESNSNGTRLNKASGIAITGFNAVGEIESGVLAIEVDVRMKDTDDADAACVNSAQVRGVGGIFVVDEEFDWVIRGNSKLDGRKRAATLSDCSGVLTVGGPCSVHRVSAGLRITAQVERDNETPKYGRTSLNQKHIFEAVEGQPPTNGEDLVLVCSCLPPLEE